MRVEYVTNRAITIFDRVSHHIAGVPPVLPPDPLTKSFENRCPYGQYVSDPVDLHDRFSQRRQLDLLLLGFVFP